jgi:hypothetical protein
MAAEAKRHRGELAAWHVAQVVARLPFTGEVLDPRQINPYREQTPPSDAAVRLERWMKKRKWRGWLDSRRKKPKGG